MRTEEADAEVLKPGGEHSGTGDDDAGDNHHSGSGGNQRESIATQLLNMCSAAGVTLFHDDEAESYATIDVRGHKETHPLTSPGFRSWLVHLYDTQVKLAPNAQAIKDALATLSSRAHYDGPRQNVATRVGKHDDQIFIDLGDDEWSIIKIDAHGWRLIPYADCAVRFRRPAKMKSLPMPVAAGASIDLLRRFANVSDAEWPLILGYLLQALRGAGPYPVLVLRGEQGTGKTTLARVLKELTDPSGVNIRSAPREIRDVVAAARNAHVLIFDNVSRIPAEISDVICALSTGGGFGGRQLYTDNTEATFTAFRPVIITSITEVATRADLLDRAIIVSPPAFAASSASDAEAARMAERDFWRNFERERPRIFAAVLDALVRGLAKEKAVTVRLKASRMTRMLDFAIWSSACLAAFGIDQKTFLDAYSDNRSHANEAALEASVISEYIRTLADGGWSGTSTDLLKKIAALADGNGRAKEFPRTPRALRAELDRIHPNLRADGIIVTHARAGKDRARRISIARAER